MITLPIYIKAWRVKRYEEKFVFGFDGFGAVPRAMLGAVGGLTLSSGGVISGTPAAQGTFNVEFQVSNDSFLTYNIAFLDITINPAPAQTKTVAVGVQNGALTFGVRGSATFDVTATGIADNVYNPSVTYPVSGSPYGVLYDAEENVLLIYDGIENGKITDPIVLMKNAELDSGGRSSGGGCNAGALVYGLFGVFLALSARFARKK